MKTIVLAILMLITFLYNGYIIHKLKTIPTSLSETSYMFKNRRLFTLYCLFVGIVLFPILVNYTTYTFLPFLIAAGLIFSGISYNYKKG